MRHLIVLSGVRFSFPILPADDDSDTHVFPHEPPRASQFHRACCWS